MKNIVIKRVQGKAIPKRVVVISVITSLIFIGEASGLTNNIKIDCMPHEYLNLLSDKGNKKVKK